MCVHPRKGNCELETRLFPRHSFINDNARAEGAGDAASGAARSGFANRVQ